MSQIKKPSIDDIKEYYDKFRNDEKLERYQIQEKAIETIMKNYPYNNNLEHILIKMTLINKFYSTNVFNITTVAKHIYNLNKNKSIDKRISSGNLYVVDDIAYVEELDRKFFSFATKYCSFHNKDSYPIYDSFVYKMLYYFNKEDKFTSKITKDNIRNYPFFKKVIDDFINYYKLYDITYKELDSYLWLYGKENFPTEK